MIVIGVRAPSSSPGSVSPAPADSFAMPSSSDIFLPKIPLLTLELEKSFDLLFGYPVVLGVLPLVAAPL